MARKSINDCRCEIQRSWDQPGVEWDVLQYNPRCEFHKGPDAGYGYDDWGRPNTKYSKAMGTIITALLVAIVLLVVVLFLYLAARGIFG